VSAIRTFIALPLGEEMCARIAAAVESLKARLPGLRWVSGAGWHLTVRFLGAASPAAVAGLEVPLCSAASRCAVGAARFAGLGVYPERGAPRVLWLGVAVPACVLELQAECETAARAAGFPAETRPFHPHVTLARWRERARRPQLPAVDLGAGEVGSLVLFRSDLGPAGSVYSPLARFSLRR
jgi:2'-5' RNA ligase